MLNYKFIHLGFMTWFSFAFAFSFLHVCLLFVSMFAQKTKTTEFCENGDFKNLQHKILNKFKLTKKLK